MSMEMKRQDLEELYQLVRVYEMVYDGIVAQKFAEEIEKRYEDIYEEKITGKRNPRKAGRKKKYTEEIRKEILALRKEGITIREIAKEMGCSVGYVQGVLSEP